MLSKILLENLNSRRREFESSWEQKKIVLEQSVQLNNLREEINKVLDNKFFLFKV
jgi:hypothetical protein